MAKRSALVEEANVGLRVHVFPEKRLPEELVQLTMGFLRAGRGPLHFVVHDAPVELRPSPFSSERPYVERTAVWGALDNLRQEERLERDVMVLCTEEPDEFNYLSTLSLEHRGIWVGPPERLTGRQRAAFIAHQIVENFLQLMLEDGGYGEDEIAHGSTLGCINDFCEKRKEVIAKLRAADVCQKCMQKLRGLGVERRLLIQCVRILDEVRTPFLVTADLRVSHLVQELPFPVALRRAWADAAEPSFVRFKALVDHLDILIRLLVLAHEPVRSHAKPHPALGDWLTELQRVTQGAAPDVNELLAPIVRKLEQERFVYLRNEMIGHGLLRSDREAEDDMEALEACVLEIDALARKWTERYSLLVVRDAILGERGSGGLRCDRAHGTTRPFRSQHLSVARVHGPHPQPGMVFIHNIDGRRLRSLQPSLILAECPSCKAERCLIADGFDESKLGHLDVEVGHRVRLSGQSSRAETTVHLA